MLINVNFISPSSLKKGEKKMKIDPHVHCRDGKQDYKETIAHVLDVAEEAGIGIVFDMPNTDPPITSWDRVRSRISLVPRDKKDRYFLYMGLTSDPNQIRHAAKCCEDYPQVIGLKLYAGKSTGNLAVIDVESQQLVYRTLAQAGYEGVLAVHCEKEEYLKPHLWNPRRPITHDYARPIEAEVHSVKDQIAFALEAGFKGHLHVCHVTCSEVVRIIKEVRSNLRISCGVTPHHLLFSCDVNQQNILFGNFFKVNPPLRIEVQRELLVLSLKKGLIDWIETDHAPHSLGEKFSLPYSSGIPSLYFYRYLVEDFLPSIGVSGELIERMTCHNISAVFWP